MIDREAGGARCRKAKVGKIGIEVDSNKVFGRVSCVEEQSARAGKSHSQRGVRWTERWSYIERAGSVPSCVKLCCQDLIRRFGAENG